MSAYLTPESPDAFIDYPRRLPERHLTEECSKCKGHGGWNNTINAYPLPKGYENTPENRHKYVHFRHSCGSCWGWGWVKPGSCPHEWDSSSGPNVGNCLNIWTCVKCGKKITVDSSG